MDGRAWTRVVDEHHAVAREYIISSVTPSQTKVDFRERSRLGECADSALEHVHEILVNDQNARTEDDVTSDRLDGERILVVNLQQSCFFPVPKF